jgi:methyl-accepting chemotaxis protein
MDEKLTIVIAITAIAEVLQMLILAGILLAIRSLRSHLKTTADDMKSQMLPIVEEVKELQAEMKKIVETASPKIDLVLDNTAKITTTAYAGIGRVETTLNDLLDRTRLQVIRADEMITRAMDTVEDTSERVAHTVTSPVKQASGVVQGISAGLNAYFGQRRREKRGPSDQMFI